MNSALDRRNGAVRPISGRPRTAVLTTGLGKEYPSGVVAASGIDIEVGKGEVVGVVGPNGAGKSTILKMVATLIAPTAGSASILDISIEEVARIRPLLGIALQDVGLDPLMTVAEHFEVQTALAAMRLGEVEARILKLTADFSLEPYLERPAGACSGGTQRRVALALALLGDPEVVIFDEPTAGLDPRARHAVWRIVEELRREGRAVLFSTQYLEEADQLSNRLYLIDQGRVVASGQPADLKAAVRNGTLAEPSLDDVFFHFTKRSLTPEPVEQSGIDLGTRMHRGGGKRW